MNKDKNPAFLFYSSDFLTGVADLTMQERGQYITLLCLQHQKGRLSEKTIRLSLGLNDLSSAHDVMQKFKADKDGMYFNARLEEEVERQIKRRENGAVNGVKGGRPKAKKEPTQNLNKTQVKGNIKGKSNLNETIKDHDNDNEIDHDLVIDPALETETENKDVLNTTKEAVAYLNRRLNTGFKHTTKSTLYAIKARINEGYGLDDFITVVDKKASDWERDPDMAKFLRPETLFGNKFEGYVNQKAVANAKQNAQSQVLDYAGFGGYEGVFEGEYEDCPIS